MQGTEIVAVERVDEVIDSRRRVPVLRESHRFPASGDHPPIAVERTIGVDGPSRAPVILVHGFAQNRYTWRVSQRSMVGYLVDRGFEVLNLELRGHGNSRAYGAGNARAFDEYVDDLVRVVAANDRLPFVIGHSLGGAVCVGAATRVPLAGLVHLAGVFAFATRNKAIRAAARASLELAPLLSLERVRMSTGWAGKLISRLYAVTDIAGYGAPIAGWVPGSVERDLLEERLRLGFDWTSVEVWLQMCRWALGHPFEYAEAFRSCDVPLLVAAGSADVLLHPDDARRCYDGSGSQDRTFVVFEPFEHEVHWGHLDLILGRRAPDIVWPCLADWLQSRDTGR